MEEHQLTYLDGLKRSMEIANSLYMKRRFGGQTATMRRLGYLDAVAEFEVEIRKEIEQQDRPKRVP